MDNRNPAFVLGMFETGLGVSRSLGRKGIRVVGIDFKKDIGFYSRYISGQICPHPLEQEKFFLDFLITQARKQREKPALFVTSDDFLVVISRNRNVLADYFLMNLPNGKIIGSVTDKYQQFILAERIGIPCPKTYSLQNIREIDEVKRKIPYPAFVKAQDVNAWRRYVSSSTKGYVVNDEKDLISKCKPILDAGINALVQEIVRGPDINHFKFCCYISRRGEFLLVFTLQKIRQLPKGYGVGSVVTSVEYPELVKIGTKFFGSMGYRGIGSAEFKLDERDGYLKLIELNPRYWQQNSLAERCGMNFPLIDYLEVTSQNPRGVKDFTDGIKWVNIYMDFDSYLSYRRDKELSLGSWFRSLGGRKVFSDFTLDDPMPAFYESKFGIRMMRMPRYLLKKIRNGNN